MIQKQSPASAGLCFGSRRDRTLDPRLRARSRSYAEMANQIPDRYDPVLRTNCVYGVNADIPIHADHSSARSKNACVPDAKVRPLNLKDAEVATAHLVLYAQRRN